MVGPPCKASSPNWAFVWLALRWAALNGQLPSLLRLPPNPDWSRTFSPQPEIQH